MADDHRPSCSSATPIPASDHPAERATVAPDTVTAPGSVSPAESGVLAPSRYRPIRFHAAGNLGEVLLAQDPELHRSVALKRIQEQYADNPESRRRFLREAEITGRLEHPGVVPVHGLGQDPDGRPCYAMRFIEGESLKEAIERFHWPGQSGGQHSHARGADLTDPGERRLMLRQLLTSFVAVCKTMAYAHSRGILHRDLKPANIMLGKFGETLVVDWGLAKTFDQGSPLAPREAENPDAPRPAQDLREVALPSSQLSADNETQMGSILGTPAYASPEQAAGDWDQVGPASDTFSLGATLYNLLTNALPYNGSALPEIIAQASMGDVVPPRQRNKNVPRALEAICLKAMARSPIERYRTALELADDVEHWLADQPVQAYSEPILVRAGRWLRRHRPLVAGTAAAAGVALISLAVVLLVVAGKNQQLEARAEAERRAKDDAQKRLEQIDKGTDILASIFEDLDPRAKDNESKPLGEVLGERAERAAKQLEGESIADALTVAKLQHILGSALTGLGHYAAAAALLEKSAATRAVELPEDHTETLITRINLADAYFFDSQFRRAIPIYQQTLSAVEASLGEDHPLTFSARNNLANAYYKVGSFDRAIPLLESTLRAREAKLGANHQDTLTTRNNLAACYLAANQLPQAIELFQKTLRAREAKLGDDHPYTLNTRSNLAGAYKAAGLLELAIPLYERTVKDSEAKVGKDHPDSIISRNNLASAYNEAGKWQLALPIFQRSVQITEAKLGADHSTTIASRNGLAASYLEAGQLDLAIPLLQRNLKSCEATLGNDHPTTLITRSHLALAYSEADRSDLAFALFDKVAPQFQKKLGPTHRSTLRFMENWILALAAHNQNDRALALGHELLTTERKQYGGDDPRLAEFLTLLGGILVSAQQLLEAETLLRESLVIRAKKLPDAWTTFETESLLGGALLGQKKYADAEPLLMRGYEGMKQRRAKIPPRWRSRYAEALERLMQLAEATNRKAEADKWRQEVEAAKAGGRKK
jgi:serine/threonine protein kinase